MSLTLDVFKSLSGLISILCNNSTDLHVHQEQLNVPSTGTAHWGLSSHREGERGKICVMSCCDATEAPSRVSKAQRQRGKYFTAGLHFVWRKVVSPLILFFYLAFIYLFSSSLIFVESCPKHLYGAMW